MRLGRLLIAVACLLPALAGCSIADHDGPLGKHGGPKPCDTAAIDEAFGSYDVRSWVFYTDHVARITVTAIDGGRHPPDGEFPVVHFDVDEVYSSRPGAPALPASAETDLLACDVDTQWVVGRTYVAPLVRVQHDGGRIHWLPIGHGALMTYAAGVLGNYDRPRSDQGWGDRFAGETPRVLAAAVEEARKPYAAFLRALWLQPDPYVRAVALVRRAAPTHVRLAVLHRGERRAEQVLKAERPDVRVIWVRRELDRRSTLDGVALKDALAASTWTDALVGDGAVYVARVDSRVAWVVQRPRWAGLDEQLVVVLHPDGTWWQALG